MFGAAGGTLFNMLGSAGVTAVLLLVITAVINRRKLGAETDNISATATKAITDAASGVVERIEGDNLRLRSRVEVLEANDTKHERARREWDLEREEWRRVLQVHAAWDALAVTRMNEAIPPITLPTAPPLTPPVIYRDHREPTN